MVPVRTASEDLFAAPPDHLLTTLSTSGSASEYEKVVTQAIDVLQDGGIDLSSRLCLEEGVDVPLRSPCHSATNMCHRGSSTSSGEDKLLELRQVPIEPIDHLLQVADVLLGESAAAVLQQLRIGRVRRKVCAAGKEPLLDLLQQIILPQRGGQLGTKQSDE